MTPIYVIAALAISTALGKNVESEQWAASSSDFFNPITAAPAAASAPAQAKADNFFTPQFKIAPPSAAHGNPHHPRQFKPPAVGAPTTNHVQHNHKDAFVFEEAVRGAAETAQVHLPGSTKISNPSLNSATSPASASFYCPDGVRVRKEFRDMTSEEWIRYKSAVKRMYEPDATGLSKQDRFTKIHLDNAATAHNTAHFLPWHRWFTFLYEEELRKFDPDVTIPYWDWTFDSQRPLASPIFSPDYLGIKTGPAGDCEWIVSYPRRHCLVRNYRQNDHKRFGTFYGRRTVDRLITDSRMTWGEFATLFETSPHGIVHFKIGGPGGDLSDMASPNDPFFFVHHSMVDYVWMQRQQFTGQAKAFGGKHRGRRATTKDELRPFRVAVEDTFDADRLCYTYQPFSGWLTAAPAALSAGANVPSGQSEHVMPDPLDQSWIDMHGWEREWVEGIERQLQALESTPLGQSVPGKTWWGQLFDMNNAATASMTVYPMLMIAVGVIAGVLVSFAM